jgi:ACS family hexuronate transporter-like MFS transporter
MKINGLRWLILSLILLVTIINYLDRGTLNYMWLTNKKMEYPLVEKATPGKPFAVHDTVAKQYLLFDGNYDKIVVNETDVSIKNENTIVHTERSGICYDLGLVDKLSSPEEASNQAKKLMATITIFFMIAYGISQLVSGRLYDKIGTRKGFIVSVALWSFADAMTSLAKGLTSLSAFRMMLGLGEAGPWPGVVKSNAEWFPVKERSVAQGLFGAAASVGSVLAPIVIGMLYLSFGWRITFVIIGSLGLLWLIPWIIINKTGPRNHPWITEKEKEHILSGQPETKVFVEKGKSWKQLLSVKKNYSVILGRFFLDAILWMFVTWLPIYIVVVFKLDIKQVAFSAWVPYLGAAIGSISGGIMSSRFIKKGKSVNFARKTAIITGACITLPAMIAAMFASDVTVAVILMAFVLGGFQFSIVNIQTIPSDLHSGKSVGSLAGLGGAAAVLGTILCMVFVPSITQSGNWTLFFVMLAALVPLSILSVLFTAGKIEPIKN